MEANFEGPTLNRVPDVTAGSHFVASSAVVTAITLYLYSSAFGLHLTQNIPVVAIVSALMIGGLCYSYSNSLYTTKTLKLAVIFRRIGFHRADKADPSASLKRTSTQAEEQARNTLIKTTSTYWSLTFVNGAFFVLFTLFSLGTTSGLPTVYKYAITSLVPPVIIAFLTEPSSK
ncbi:hypothetical protein HDU76_002442 [Blyttiomyces sp. JEL0837]|nr:hypothetical protein HDU76_002442 [Blyttiomyces sp. JEL0837]